MWEPLANTPAVWAAIERLAHEPSPIPDRALLATYLSSVRDDDSAAEPLDDLVAAFERGFERSALIGGLAGAAWVVNHVAPDTGDLLAACDSSLLRVLETCDGPSDLTHGLVGLAIYFLDRDSEAAARARILAVDELARRLPLRDEPIDCGVPHGLAGIAGLLRRIGGDRASALADTSARWLLAQVRGDELPETIVAGEPRFARTGWCYGAPGAMLALGGPDALTGWLARPPWSTESLALCHGAAGLMHAANRMYQATRTPAYRDAALAWLERVLAAVDDVPAGDLLDGSAGVALALLAMASDLPPAWDRMLLCDLPDP